MSTLYLRELGPRQMVRLFCKHGWHHLELSECHAYDLLTQGDPVPVGKAFRHFAAEHGICFPQGHLPVVWYSQADKREATETWFDVAPEGDLDTARATDAMSEWIDLFSALGVRTGVLHMGGFQLRDAGWSDEAIFERRVEALSTIAEYAARGGMTICLENMVFPNCGVETVEDISALIAAVGTDNLVVCFDTGHALPAGLDCVESVLNAGRLIKALHIHENMGTGDDHVLPYERGTIPWDRVLAALCGIEYTGPFNLEIPGRPGRPMPVREARLDYAKAVASYLVERALRRDLTTGEIEV